MSPVGCAQARRGPSQGVPDSCRTPQLLRAEDPRGGDGREESRPVPSSGPRPARNQCQAVPRRRVTTVFAGLPRACLDRGDPHAHLEGADGRPLGVTPERRCPGLCGAGGVETGPSSSSHLGPPGARGGDRFRRQRSGTLDGGASSARVGRGVPRLWALGGGADSAGPASLEDGGAKARQP